MNSHSVSDIYLFILFSVFFFLFYTLYPSPSKAFLYVKILWTPKLKNYEKIVTGSIGLWWILSTFNNFLMKLIAKKDLLKIEWRHKLPCTRSQGGRWVPWGEVCIVPRTWEAPGRRVCLGLPRCPPPNTPLPCQCMNIVLSPRLSSSDFIPPLDWEVFG